MIGSIPIDASIVQDVLDNTIRFRRPPAALNYAAYAVETGPDTEGDASLQVICRSSNDRYLTQLLGRFSGPNSKPEEQIGLWEELLPKIHKALVQLDDVLVKTGQGENVRTVLDVDMGGFIYSRINRHTILFGATLDQAKLNTGQCEREMKQMVSEIHAVFTAHGA